MKKSSAAVIAVLLPCLAYAAIVALTEQASGNTGTTPGREKRAALAIRDNVTPFQKWGSRNFTLPYLNRYYDAAWYFTQSDPRDCRQLFLARLDEALKRYPQVDLFILAHDNRLVTWIEGLPAEQRERLRLVYNTGCYDLKQGPLWLSLGAKAYVGHPGYSVSPVFYFYFLRRWTRGIKLADAIEESNALMRLIITRAQLFSFGKLKMDKKIQESEAFCYGDRELHL